MGARAEPAAAEVRRAPTRSTPALLQGEASGHGLAMSPGSGDSRWPSPSPLPTRGPVGAKQSEPRHAEAASSSPPRGSLWVKPHMNETILKFYFLFFKYHSFRFFSSSGGTVGVRGRREAPRLPAASAAEAGLGTVRARRRSPEHPRARRCHDSSRSRAGGTLQQLLSSGDKPLILGLQLSVAQMAIFSLAAPPPRAKHRKWLPAGKCISPLHPPWLCPGAKPLCRHPEPRVGSSLLFFFSSVILLGKYSRAHLKLRLTVEISGPFL